MRSWILCATPTRGFGLKVGFYEQSFSFGLDGGGNSFRWVFGVLAQTAQALALGKSLFAAHVLNMPCENLSVAFYAKPVGYLTHRYVPGFAGLACKVVLLATRYGAVPFRRSLHVVPPRAVHTYGSVSL